MARWRVVLVVPRRGYAASPLQRYVVGSIAAHVGIVIVLLLAPTFRSRAQLPDDTLFVELVAVAPPRSTPAAAPSRPPAPAPRVVQPTERPREARVEPMKPPEPKPLPVDPAPVKTRDPDPPTPAPPPRVQPAPGEAGDGSVDPIAASATGDPSGAVAALDLGGSELAWYATSVRAALYANWSKPILTGVREPVDAVVTFEILRDGRVAAVRIEASSGLASLDRSALRAVSDAAPLPPLPPNWREPTLPARFVFRLFPE